MGLEISSSFRLTGDSSFWMFLRSESMDQDTVVVKVSLENLTNKVFASLGSWLQFDENDTYKVFCKQQLIDFDKGKVQSAITDKSSYSIRIIVLDNNEDRVVVKAFLNKNKLFNEVSSDFFIPFTGDYKLTIAGSGESIVIDNINSRCFSKTIIDEDNQFSSEKNNCTCCSIY